MKKGDNEGKIQPYTQEMRLHAQEVLRLNQLHRAFGNGYPFPMEPDKKVTPLKRFLRSIGL